MGHQIEELNKKELSDELAKNKYNQMHLERHDKEMRGKK